MMGKDGRGLLLSRVAVDGVAFPYQMCFCCSKPTGMPVRLSRSPRVRVIPSLVTFRTVVALFTLDDLKRKCVWLLLYFCSLV